MERELRINTDLGNGAVPVVTVQATVEGQPAEGSPQQAPEEAQTSVVPAAGATATAAIP